MSLQDHAHKDKVREILENEDTSVKNTVEMLSKLAGVTTSERAVRRWRQNNTVNTSKSPAVALSSSALQTSSGLELGPDGGELSTGTMREKINGDWNFVFERFGLDPTKYAIVDNTVRMSAWDSANGEQLFSYRARFVRLAEGAISKEQIESWRTLLLQGVVPEVHVEAKPLAYVICVADAQLGKPGTTKAIEKWRQGIAEHMARIGSLPVSQIVLAFMGDEHEGVANNYEAQNYLVELNFSEQLELDFDLRIWTIRELAHLGIPLDVISVPSNHGEFTRNGSKDPVTSIYDNSSTLIGRLVRSTFEGRPAYDHINWFIPSDAPDVFMQAAGVGCYFSHGHVARGSGPDPESKVKSAIEKQVLSRPEDFNGIKLFWVAHYHHFYMREFGNRTLFGCPALEAEKSSQYMYDKYGVWNHPGMLGVLVSSDFGPRGYGEMVVY